MKKLLALSLILGLSVFTVACQQSGVETPGDEVPEEGGTVEPVEPEAEPAPAEGQ